MRERPILFSAPLVRAILDGTKTVTRRPVKRENRPEPGNEWGECCCREIDPSDTPCVVCEARFGACPYGIPGDRLWVRETFHECPHCAVRYRADYADEEPLPRKCAAHATWRPSIFMRRNMSRILLEVTEVRVERLQEITEEDAKAEGIERTNGHPVRGAVFGCAPSYREGFAQKWIDIYSAESWAANPWVWRVAFKRIEPIERRKTRFEDMPGGGVCRCLNDASPVVCDGCEVR